jgi:2-polyprenyl-3-methyl-5-hydroxy-6-metoxy-1,4-benzoquinol methylase
MEQWEVVHQWEWFRRNQWLSCFRDTKLLLCEAVTGLLLERGLADGLVLDCSCGLGSQAITFAEAGLRVIGSDRSCFSVARAEEMARSHALEIEFFHALWQELPARTTHDLTPLSAMHSAGFTRTGKWRRRCMACAAFCGRVAS